MRYIDGDKAIEDAEYLYNLYVMAMANADTQREINHVFKRQELFKAVKAVVEHCPTVDPIKHGEWVEDICCDGIFICNSCGNEAYFDLDEGTYILFDYCPFCGAKMGGDKE